MSRASAVDAYATLALDTRWADIPDAARRSACVFLLDSLGVGVSGAAADTAGAVRDTASGWGRGSQCSVLGSDLRLPPSSAAYVNAFQVHCQEFDCLHEPATVHAMAVLTGALLAMAEREHYAPEELLLGVVLGVEVAVTLGLCATTGLRFFRPATAGLMGATAALARLQGFDARRFRDAWGLAYSQMAGTMQAHVEGSVALPLQVAGAARAAVNSIELVEAGLSGPHDVLEGLFGYFTLFETNANPAPVLATLGKPWRVTELAHKPFPTGRAAHATLDGLQRLMQTHAIAANDIVAVRAHVPPLVKRLVGRPYRAGMSVNYARLCLQYLVPVYLRNGHMDTRCFSPRWLADADVAAASGMVSVIDDGNPDPNALSPQRLEVDTASGACLEQEVTATLGSPDYPLDEAQRMAKLQHCFAAGGLPASAADRLAAMLQAPDSLSNVNDMIAACTARPGGP